MMLFIINKPDCGKYAGPDQQNELNSEGKVRVRKLERRNPYFLKRRKIKKKKKVGNYLGSVI